MLKNVRFEINNFLIKLIRKMPVCTMTHSTLYRIAWKTKISIAYHFMLSNTFQKRTFPTAYIEWCSLNDVTIKFSDNCKPLSCHMFKMKVVNMSYCGQVYLNKETNDLCGNKINAKRNYMFPLNARYPAIHIMGQNRSGCIFLCK